MAQINTVFAPTANTTTFNDLADQTFFEYGGKLNFKVDDERYFYLDTDQRIEFGHVDDGEIDYDTIVIQAPAGTGFTLMQ